MGALILISGPNGSGKSRFAENLIGALGERNRYYIATMLPATAENLERIAAHRRQREGMAFHTLELPFPSAVGAAPVEPDAVVLLEDVSNLLANALFADGKIAAETAEAAAYRALLRLRDRCALLVAVTVSGLDPAPYTGETQAYILALHRLNLRLRKTADAGTALKNGVPNKVFLDLKRFSRYSKDMDFYQNSHKKTNLEGTAMADRIPNTDLLHWKRLDRAGTVRLTSLLDRMDPEVAKKALEKYPDFSGAVSAMERDRKESQDLAMAQNDASIKRYYEACGTILEVLKAQLEDGRLSYEQKRELLGQMKEVTAMMGGKDAENKKFLQTLLRTGAFAACAFAILLFAALGGRAKVEK